MPGTLFADFSTALGLSEETLKLISKASPSRDEMAQIRAFALEFAGKFQNLNTLMTVLSDAPEALKPYKDQMVFALLANLSPEAQANQIRELSSIASQALIQAALRSYEQARAENGTTPSAVEQIKQRAARSKNILFETLYQRIEQRCKETPTTENYVRWLKQLTQDMPEVDASDVLDDLSHYQGAKGGKSVSAMLKAMRPEEVKRDRESIGAERALFQTLRFGQAAGRSYAKGLQDRLKEALIDPRVKAENERFLSLVPFRRKISELCLKELGLNQPKWEPKEIESALSDIVADLLKTHKGEVSEDAIQKKLRDQLGTRYWTDERGDILPHVYQLTSAYCKKIVEVIKQNKGAEARNILMQAFRGINSELDNRFIVVPLPPSELPVNIQTALDKYHTTLTTRQKIMFSKLMAIEALGELNRIFWPHINYLKDRISAINKAKNLDALISILDDKALLEAIDVVYERTNIRELETKYLLPQFKADLNATCEKLNKLLTFFAEIDPTNTEQATKIRQAITNLMSLSNGKTASNDEYRIIRTLFLSMNEYCINLLGTIRAKTAVINRAEGRPDLTHDDLTKAQEQLTRLNEAKAYFEKQERHILSCASQYHAQTQLLQKTINPAQRLILSELAAAQNSADAIATRKQAFDGIFDPNKGENERKTELLKLFEADYLNDPGIARSLGISDADRSRVRIDLEAMVDTSVKLISRFEAGQPLLTKEEYKAYDEAIQQISAALGDDLLQAEFKIKANQKGRITVTPKGKAPIDIELEKTLPFSLFKFPGSLDFTLSYGGTRGSKVMNQTMDKLYGREENQQKRGLRSIFLAGQGQQAVFKLYQDLDDGLIFGATAGVVKQDKVEATFKADLPLEMSAFASRDDTGSQAQAFFTEAFFPGQFSVPTYVEQPDKDRPANNFWGTTQPLRYKIFQEYAMGKSPRDVTAVELVGLNPSSEPYHNPVARKHHGKSPLEILHDKLALAEAITEEYEKKSKSGFHHNDVKPENMIFYEKPDGSYGVQIIDIGTFGGETKDFQKGSFFQARCPDAIKRKLNTESALELDELKQLVTAIYGTKPADLETYSEDGTRICKDRKNGFYFKFKDGKLIAGRDPILAIEKTPFHATLPYLPPRPKAPRGIVKNGDWCFGHDSTLMDDWALMVMTFGLCRRDDFFELSQGRKIDRYLIPGIIEKANGKLEKGKDFDKSYMDAGNGLMYVPTTKEEGEPLHVFRHLKDLESKIDERLKAAPQSPNAKYLSDLQGRLRIQLAAIHKQFVLGVPWNKTELQTQLREISSIQQAYQNLEGATQTYSKREQFEDVKRRMNSDERTDEFIAGKPSPLEIMLTYPDPQGGDQSDFAIEMLRKRFSKWETLNRLVFRVGATDILSKMIQVKQGRLINALLDLPAIRTEGSHAGDTIYKHTAEHDVFHHLAEQGLTSSVEALIKLMSELRRTKVEIFDLMIKTPSDENKHLKWRSNVLMTAIRNRDDALFSAVLDCMHSGMTKNNALNALRLAAELGVRDSKGELYFSRLLEKYNSVVSDENKLTIDTPQLLELYLPLMRDEKTSDGVDWKALERAGSPAKDFILKSSPNPLLTAVSCGNKAGLNQLLDLVQSLTEAIRILQNSRHDFTFSKGEREVFFFPEDRKEFFLSKEAGKNVLCRFLENKDIDGFIAFYGRMKAICGNDEAYGYLMDLFQTVDESIDPVLNYFNVERDGITACQNLNKLLDLVSAEANSGHETDRQKLMERYQRELKAQIGVAGQREIDPRGPYHQALRTLFVGTEGMSPEVKKQLRESFQSSAQEGSPEDKFFTSIEIQTLPKARSVIASAKAAANLIDRFNQFIAAIEAGDFKALEPLIPFRPESLDDGFSPAQKVQVPNVLFNRMVQLCREGRLPSEPDLLAIFMNGLLADYNSRLSEWEQQKTHRSDDPRGLTLQTDLRAFMEKLEQLKEIEPKSEHLKALDDLIADELDNFARRFNLSIERAFGQSDAITQKVTEQARKLKAETDKLKAEIEILRQKPKSSSTQTQTEPRPTSEAVGIQVDTLDIRKMQGQLEQLTRDIRTKTAEEAEARRNAEELEAQLRAIRETNLGSSLRESRDYDPEELRTRLLRQQQEERFTEYEEEIKRLGAESLELKQKESLLRAQLAVALQKPQRASAGMQTEASPDEQEEEAQLTVQQSLHDALVARLIETATQETNLLKQKQDELQAELLKLSRKADAAEARAKGIENEKSEAEKALKLAGAKVSKLEGDLAENQRAYADALKKHEASAAEKLEELRKELESQLTEQRTAVLRFEEDRDLFSRKRESFDDQHNQFETEKEAFRAQIDELRAREEALSNWYQQQLELLRNDMSREAKALRGDRDELEGQLKKARTDLNELREKAAATDGKTQLHVAQLAEKEQEIATLQRDLLTANEALKHQALAFKGTEEELARLLIQNKSQDELLTALQRFKNTMPHQPPEKSETPGPTSSGERTADTTPGTPRAVSPGEPEGPRNNVFVPTPPPARPKRSGRPAQGPQAPGTPPLPEGGQPFPRSDSDSSVQSHKKLPERVEGPDSPRAKPSRVRSGVELREEPERMSPQEAEANLMTFVQRYWLNLERLDPEDFNESQQFEHFERCVQSIPLEVQGDFIHAIDSLKLEGNFERIKRIVDEFDAIWNIDEAMLHAFESNKENKPWLEHVIHCAQGEERPDDQALNELFGVDFRRYPDEFYSVRDNRKIYKYDHIANFARRYLRDLSRREQASLGGRAMPSATGAPASGESVRNRLISFIDQHWLQLYPRGSQTFHQSLNTLLGKQNEDVRAFLSSPANIDALAQHHQMISATWRKIGYAIDQNIHNSTWLNQVQEDLTDANDAALNIHFGLDEGFFSRFPAEFRDTDGKYKNKYQFIQIVLNEASRELTSPAPSTSEPAPLPQSVPPTPTAAPAPRRNQRNGSVPTPAAGHGQNQGPVPVPAQPPQAQAAQALTQIEMDAIECLIDVLNQYPTQIPLDDLSKASTNVDFADEFNWLASRWLPAPRNLRAIQHAIDVLASPTASPTAFEAVTARATFLDKWNNDVNQELIKCDASKLASIRSAGRNSDKGVMLTKLGLPEAEFDAIPERYYISRGQGLLPQVFSKFDDIADRARPIYRDKRKAEILTNPLTVVKADQQRLQTFRAIRNAPGWFGSHFDSNMRKAISKFANVPFAWLPVFSASAQYYADDMLTHYQKLNRDAETMLTIFADQVEEIELMIQSLPTEPEIDGEPTITDKSKIKSEMSKHREYLKKQKEALVDAMIDPLQVLKVLNGDNALKGTIDRLALTDVRNELEYRMKLDEPNSVTATGVLDRLADAQTGDRTLILSAKVMTVHQDFPVANQTAVLGALPAIGAVTATMQSQLPTRNRPYEEGVVARLAPGYFRVHTVGATAQRDAQGQFTTPEGRFIEERSRTGAETFTMQAFPAMPANPTKAQEEETHARRVKVSLAMAAHIIASLQHRPSPDHPILLDSSDEDQLKYLTAAVLALGEAAGKYKFDRHSIRVNSHCPNFTLRTDKAWKEFGVGIVLHSGFYKRFINDSQVKSIQKMAKALCTDKFSAEAATKDIQRVMKEASTEAHEMKRGADRLRRGP